MPPTVSLGQGRKDHRLQQTVYTELLNFAAKMSGVGAKIAGEILGPRPGLAIVSFMQGRVEILLRILAPLVRRRVGRNVALRAIKSSVLYIANNMYYTFQNLSFLILYNSLPCYNRKL